MDICRSGSITSNELGNSANACQSKHARARILLSDVPSSRSGRRQFLTILAKWRVPIPVSVTNPRPAPLVTLQPEKAIVSGVSLML